jgi:hypothetical protein
MRMKQTVCEGWQKVPCLAISEGLKEIKDPYGVHEITRFQAWIKFVD